MNLLLLLPLAFTSNGESATVETAPVAAVVPIGGILGFTTQEWSLNLSGGERAYIIVEGSGTSDLDASLLDASGNAVVADEGLADSCLLTFAPPSTGTYTLSVTNRGHDINLYDIRVETPGANVLDRASAWLRIHARRHQHIESYRARLLAQVALSLGVPHSDSRAAMESLMELLAHQESHPATSHSRGKEFRLEEEFATCPLRAKGTCPMKFE